ncbi:MAG: NAD(P)-binding protein, partial [Rhodospirillales bacterium]|nr:NAD(P)-binding protein [Rhodospirillales bacterium]
MKPLHIAIAGAGTTGLAAAAFLTRAGHDVRLF